MAVRVGKALFDGWVSLELPAGWSDTFIFRMSPTDGLPPADYAQVIKSLIPAVLKLRKSASVWVQIGGEATGASWFCQAVCRALRGLPAPVAVTSASVPPQIWDFSFYPWTDSQPLASPPIAEPYLKGRNLNLAALSCLRVLARADCAYTAEVASLVDRDLKAVRKTLHSLEEDNLVQLMENGRYPYWMLRRPGLSTALRSWGLPPGQAFPCRKERGRPACKERGNSKRKTQSSSGRHRRTARLWPAWLRKAWPQAKIWAGWTEVACGRTRPDALCWGLLDGYETLYWLEVESGNASRVELRNKTLRRVNQALVYARGFQMRLVFALLGRPWVCREAVRVFRDLPNDVAAVVEDWKAFGGLPVPNWGKAAWR